MAVLQEKAGRYIGHNPAGAAMIVPPLASLFFALATGLAVDGTEENPGPLTGLLSKNGDLWEECHELLGNCTIVLALVTFMQCCSKAGALKKISFDR